MVGKCTRLFTTDVQVGDIIDLLNGVRSALVGDYPVSKPGLAIGTTATNVANDAFDYNIGGVRYTKAAVAAGTAPGNDVIPEDTYGAVAFDIDAAGTITAVEAPDNATGYASAALAVAALPAVAANKARMGWVTATSSSGAFTFGTTDLDAANTTVAYTDGDAGLETIGSAIADIPSIV